MSACLSVWVLKHLVQKFPKMSDIFFGIIHMELVCFPWSPQSLSWHHQSTWAKDPMPIINFCTLNWIRTLTFIVTCSGLLAPVMTVETLGFLRHQANAKAAVVPPNSIFALPPSVSSSSRKRFMNGSSLMARRESSGIPSLYFPERRPEARGDQIVVP